MSQLKILVVRALVLAATGLLLVPSAAFARKAKESKEEKLEKPRMAILAFPAAPGAMGCPGWGANEGRMANVLRDLFTTAIMEEGEGKVRVVERERLEQVRSELQFQQGGEVDGATAQKVGKLLGVRYMLAGKITRFACKRSNAASGWGVGALVGKATKSGLAGAIAGSAKGEKVKFSGRLDLRLIDTQSGEVLGAFKDEEDTSDLSVGIAGGGSEVKYDDELANKVFEPVAERLAPKIVKKVRAVHEENLAEDEEEREAEGAGRAEEAPVGAGKTGRGGEAKGAADAPGGKGGAGPAAPAAPAVFGNEFDFVPGEKVFFFDDFTDTDVGDSPMRWKGGGLAVVESDGRRWMQDTGTGPFCKSQEIRFDVKNDFPKKFTVEFDAVLGRSYYGVWFGNASGAPSISVAGDKIGMTGDDKRIPLPTGVQHIAISVNETYAKLYVGGKRVAQSTDAFKRPFKKLGICFKNQGAVPLVTSFRIAEGGKDYSTELTSVGRIVTHGITFESGSDRLRPESGPTLRAIQKLLQDDAALRFEIQGHTDSQGGDGVNAPLSERRAAAVKGWLVGQGIDAGRLGTKGLGAAKPIDSNDTPEGRANNRRVEFVKV